MSSLTELPNLVGFFSYSRIDNHGGILSELAEEIYRELCAQLGRSPSNFRLWRDKDTLARGNWSDLKKAVSESVFFIMMVSPNSVESSTCVLEFNAFVNRQRELRRDDLIFPVLYSPVSGLEPDKDTANPVLSAIKNRKTPDWTGIATDRSFASVKASLDIKSFCADIANTLRKSVPLSELMLASKTSAEVNDVEAEPIIEAQKPQSRLLRNTPEYWLNRVAVERKLAPGDQPLVLISFASADQKWVDDLRAFLDPKVELLRDNGHPYSLWNYSDAKRGTAPGDEFPEIVAEKMWRCRVAILLFSANYFKSDYCKVIELPFLLWRRDHHGLMCLPIKLGTLPFDRVQVPEYQCDARFVHLNELIDDRQAKDNFASSRYRDWTLRQLREEGKESEIEDRFAGIARHVEAFLKTRFSAMEVGEQRQAEQRRVREAEEKRQAEEEQERHKAAEAKKHAESERLRKEAEHLEQQRRREQEEREREEGSARDLERKRKADESPSANERSDQERHPQPIPQQMKRAWTVGAIVVVVSGIVALISDQNLGGSGGGLVAIIFIASTVVFGVSLFGLLAGVLSQISRRWNEDGRS